MASRRRWSNIRLQTRHRCFGLGIAARQSEMKGVACRPLMPMDSVPIRDRSLPKKQLILFTSTPPVFNRCPAKHFHARPSDLSNYFNFLTDGMCMPIKVHAYHYLFFPIGWMVWVCRPAVQTYVPSITNRFQVFLCLVMTMVTQGLQITVIE
jgi:hypothetical protein